MKLKSNREYWNELRTKDHPFFDIELFNKHMQFTGQEPKLEMFVNLLEKPEDYDIHDYNALTYKNQRLYLKECKKYQQAENKILFKGFEAKKVKDYYIVTNGEHIWLSWNKSKTLEDFIGCELTEQGIKQVGYEF